jgi:FMN phosphatase YigB (HAD superfamily)
MITNKQKIILTDVDGVLLDWEEGFSVWMEHHGHTMVDGGKLMYKIGDRYSISNNQGHKLVRQFNESAAMGFLPPLRDAQYYVKLLAEKHQYRFLAVTSLSLDPYAKELRTRNLKKIFGNDTFVDVICLDTGADKDEILAELAQTYKGNWWIEDKPENCDTGLKFGLRPILIDHPHNQWYDNPNVVRVNNWKEIVELILNEE